MPRPKMEVDTEPLNFRIDKRILDKVEEKWRLGMYKNRTEFMIEAISDRVNAVVCPFCDARNPKGGRVCSVCLRPLTVNDEVNTLVKVVNLNKETGEEEEV